MSSYHHIISLVPSLTELLIDLGLSDRIVGRTRFCVHPKDEVQEIPITGGTKNPRLDKIYDAAPDLIIANKEENRREDIEALANDFDVELTEIETIEDALIAINKIGEKLDVSEQ
ncbi:MAG TPA: helical backbone metal receptor, partial [Balneolaceae bacterium]|nr:helical backbone metal receptor [Balneolaceae bacterium]